MTIPPAPGGAEIASGIRQPKSRSVKSLRYCPQLTAIAAPETAYSSSRHQPTAQAANSPSVAYA
ncbi:MULTISPECIES: hypothetical protein [Streptomyces]|uniref:Uncharacterized protein n=1 Tax=Streptomyces bugieae TaxID=3098223 RepID=A0ABU7NGE1_9ACTN|nr:hypothetical protein [Streptomyces nigrescens]MEE4417927.1 hypothetical protein [Streptomyces sp. DSM 41528]